LIPDTTPISGNAGSNVGCPNNSDFILYLLSLFNITTTNISEISVNPGNFAVNNTPFDYTQIVNGTSIYQVPGAYKLGSQNTQTLTNDSAFIDNNRVVGKALFGINTSGLREDAGFLTGIDTTCVKTMNLNFGTQTTQMFPRNSTMNIWYKCHQLFLLHHGRLRRIYT